VSGVRAVGVISFLVVLVGAVSVAVIAGFNSLITGDESIRLAWERLQDVQGERAALMADIILVMDPDSLPAAELEEWRRARSELGAATDIGEEVNVQHDADRAFDRLLAAVREAVAADDEDKAGDALSRFGEISRRLGVARRLYNEEVGRYRRLLGRIPTRWLAGAFGFENFPEYD